MEDRQRTGDAGACGGPCSETLPVGGTVELGVDALLVHHGPGCCGDKELLVDAVP